MTDAVGRLLPTGVRVAAYLEERHVILGARKVLQSTVGSPQLRHLPLDLLQQLLGLAHGHLLLEPDQLLRLDAPLLNTVDQLGEDPLALLGRRFRRVLQGSSKVTKKKKKQSPSASADE